MDDFVPNLQDGTSGKGSPPTMNVTFWGVDFDFFRVSGPGSRKVTP
jgi:hypothetical protein